MGVAGRSSTSTILVVDDDASIRLLVSKRLEAQGYRCLEVESGERALERIKLGGIDLVVLDLMMPGLDGFGVLGSLREHHAFRQLPVLVASAKDDGQSVIQAMRAGANDYVTKPIDFDLFFKRVDTHLRLRNGMGTQLGPYEIVDRLGGGGMASVYRARDTRSDSEVALKVLPRAFTVDEEVLKRFKREAQVLEALDHPHIVKFFEDGVDGETHYIAMELVEGQSLEECQGAPLDVEHVLGIGAELAAAVAHLHERGLVHRDIKPANVVLRPSGEAVLVDFGVVHNPGGNLTQAGVGVGSLFYGAPEQLRGEPEPASDVYGLGATLLLALTGREPYDADTPFGQLLSRKGTEGVPAAVAGRVPGIVLPFFREMLSGDPQARPKPLKIKAELVRLTRLSRRIRRPTPWRMRVVAIAATLAALLGGLWVWSALR